MTDLQTGTRSAKRDQENRPNRASMRNLADKVKGLAVFARPRTLRDWRISVLSVGLAIAAWAVLSESEIVPRTALPTIGGVLGAAKDVWTNGYQGVTLWQDITVSLSRIGLGFGCAVVVGVPIGIWIGESRIMEAVLDPYVQFLRPLPPLGYYTLLIIWFGIGDTSKIVLLFLTGVPIIIVSVADAVRRIDKGYLEAVAPLKLSRPQYFAYVILPGSLGGVFTGSRVALGATFGSLVAAELIAADSGLGWLILTASNYVQTEIVYVGIIVIGLIALLLDRIVVFLSRVMAPWTGRS